MGGRERWREDGDELKGRGIPKYVMGWLLFVKGEGGNTKEEKELNPPLPNLTSSSLGSG